MMSFTQVLSPPACPHHFFDAFLLRRSQKQELELMRVSTEKEVAEMHLASSTKDKDIRVAQQVLVISYGGKRIISYVYDTRRNSFEEGLCNINFDNKIILLRDTIN